MEKTYETAAETARKIRAALKAFPGVKFSVTSKSYSGGSSVSVSWTDGPLASVVDKVVKVFEGATFDAMTDYKDTPGYKDPVSGQLCKGADFVFTQRSRSPELDAKLEALLRERHADADRLLADNRFSILNQLEAGDFGAL